MTVVNVWVGATTEDAARVVTKVSSVANVRVAVDTDPGFGAPVFYGPVTPTAEQIASVTIDGLDPDTRYYYRVEHAGVLDSTFPGQFLTHPLLGQPANFSFAAATCAGGAAEFPGVGAVLASSRISNHPVFETIRSRAVTEGMLFFFHGGDFNYYDLNDSAETHGIVGGGSLANYRRSYDDVLLQPNQHGLYRDLALVYSCGAGGHDWGQPIGLARTLPGRNNVLQAWRERAPHYPTADPEVTAGTYHSFQVGRVLFVVTDENADRDPDPDPDGPGKTKLGPAQKAWLQQLLSTTEAEALVWLSGAQWENAGSANWGRYTFERAEVQQMLGDLGWLDRMVFITGDRHALEIVQAQNNPFGGFPIWHFASLDSPGTGSIPGQTSGGNNRYGTVEVTDDGSTITFVGKAYIGTELWKSDTLVISTQVGPGPTPPPDPAPPVAQAAIRTRVTWLSCDLASGRVIGELQDITGDVERLIGEIKSSGLTLPIPLAGPASHDIAFVEQTTAPGRTMLVAVVNDVPTWAGIPIGPIEGGTDAVVTIPTMTLEGYLDRRVVRDHEWVQQDEASVIAAGLLADAGDIPGVGVGIGLVIDAPPTGTLRDRTYKLTDRKTVYTALRELMAVENGPEWMIDIDWTDQAHNAIAKIARVRKRLGVAEANPASVFQTTAHSVFASLGSSEARYKHRHDWSAGRGANYVVAYSSGEGEDQPSSTPAIAGDLLASGFPIYEEHFQPSSDISQISTLNAHARAALARRRDGWQSIHIEARWDAYPRYGVDWRLGDDVAWQLIGHRHPDGLSGQGRVIGFTLDMQRQVMIPILHEEDDE